MPVPLYIQVKARSASCQYEREGIIDASHNLSAKPVSASRKFLRRLTGRGRHASLPAGSAPKGMALDLTPHGGRGSLSI